MKLIRLIKPSVRIDRTVETVDVGGFKNFPVRSHKKYIVDNFIEVDLRSTCPVIEECLESHFFSFSRTLIGDSWWS